MRVICIRPLHCKILTTSILFSSVSFIPTSPTEFKPIQFSKATCEPLRGTSHAKISQISPRVQKRIFIASACTHVRFYMYTCKYATYNHIPSQTCSVGLDVENNYRLLPNSSILRRLFVMVSLRASKHTGEATLSWESENENKCFSARCAGNVGCAGNNKPASGVCRRSPARKVVT